MRPSALVDHLKSCYQAKIGCLVLGGPGIGKSEIARQVADQLKIGFLDLRLAYYDTVDLRGMPGIDRNSESHTTVWYPPRMLPTSGAGIILLDELTAATPSVQTVAYQIMLDKGIANNYKMPNDWVAFAAGNRQEDRAVANRIPSPLISRNSVVTLEHNFEDWYEWAMKSPDVQPEVLGYLKFNSSALHDFNPAKWVPNTPYACPRSWVLLSRYLKTNRAMAYESLELISSFVGEGSSREFFTYINTYKKLPSFDEIIKNPAKAKLPTEPSILHAVAINLARKISVENLEKAFIYLQRLPKDFQTITVKELVDKEDEFFSKTPQWEIWADANPELAEDFDNPGAATE